MTIINPLANVKTSQQRCGLKVRKIHHSSTLYFVASLITACIVGVDFLVWKATICMQLEVNQDGVKNANSCVTECSVFVVDINLCNWKKNLKLSCTKVCRPSTYLQPLLG